jgi:diguanylate cyclase (GGDEF)-like protein
MSTAAFALLAAAFALSFVVVVAVVIVRARRVTERRLDAGLLMIGKRMDALAGELASAVERVREDAIRARIVESLGRALDLDEVLARCVEAAAALHGVDGAIVTAEVDGEELVAAAGVDTTALGSGGAGIVGGPPDGSRVRAVGISYHYPVETLERVGMRSAVAVPLESAQGHLGFLTVFGRSEEPPVTGADFQTLEALVRHTGPAIDAARRRDRGERQAEGSDPLTGLGNRTSLHETLALEVARAHRHARRLAVCAVDIDDFGRVNARNGQIAADGILVAIAELLRETMRPADLAYRSGGDEFTVILPDAGRIEGEALYARLQATLRRSADSPMRDIGLSAGIAELKQDDDGVSIYERAERALQRAKAAGKGTAA